MWDATMLPGRRTLCLGVAGGELRLAGCGGLLAALVGPAREAESKNTSRRAQRSKTHFTSQFTPSMKSSMDGDE
jgi:hypothetical protein